MATNAYLERLNQLQQKKEETVSKNFGIPINRPLNKQIPGLAGTPTQPDEDPGPDMSSQFGMNFQNFEGEDMRFKDMMAEFSDLASGLGQAVRQGYMTEPIAKNRLQSYINDSRKYFQNNKANLMDNPQFNEAMKQMIMGRMDEQNGVEPIADPRAENGVTPVPEQGGM